jgi:hypothetical protein
MHFNPEILILPQGILLVFLSLCFVLYQVLAMQLRLVSIYHPPASTSPVLRLQACATTPGFLMSRQYWDPLDIVSRLGKRP